MASNFDERDEVGASAAAFVGEELVFDIWAGEASPGVAWTEDTIVPVFSTTKGATALVIQVLVDRGLIDVGRPVCEYWPEFAQHGKEGITVEHVLTHTSGVLRVENYQALVGDGAFLNDLDRIAEVIANCKPDFPPSAYIAYQAVTYGFILGELVRRVDGRSLGTVWRQDIAAPHGIDFHIGLEPGEHGRVARLIDAADPTEEAVQFYLSMFTPDTLQGQAMMVSRAGLAAVADRANDPATLTAEIPAAGGVGSARAIATWYAILANGGELRGRRLVSPESIAAHTAERSSGTDMVSMLESRFGLGYALPTELTAYADIPTAFGHSGLGGSVGFADPATNIAFGYTMNQIRYPGPTDPTRAGVLVQALYSSLS